MAFHLVWLMYDKTKKTYRLGPNLQQENYHGEFDRIGERSSVDCAVRLHGPALVSYGGMEVSECLFVCYLFVQAG